MRLTRFFRAALLALVPGVFGLNIGCGTPTQQVALDEVDADGMLVSRKGIRTFNKQQRESAKANSADRKSRKDRVNGP
jgi:hypothetical protein